MKKKITHDYTCDICGKTTTRNIQDEWAEYSITDDGDFIEKSRWDGGTNGFYCDDCEEEGGGTK